MAGDDFDICVIGAGSGGLSVAYAASHMGQKVALIEGHRMGGDCLNVGCVPSKAILSSARRAAAVREAANFGIHADAEMQVHFAEVMERMRRLRARISPHDSAKRFTEMGVYVYFGQGTFRNRQQLEVAGRLLDFKRAVIATGARPAVL